MCCCVQLPAGLLHSNAQNMWVGLAALGAAPVMWQTTRRAVSLEPDCMEGFQAQLQTLRLGA